MLAAMLVCLLFLHSFFELPRISKESILVLAAMMTACPTIQRFLLLIFDDQMARRDNRVSAGKSRRKSRKK